MNDNILTYFSSYNPTSLQELEYSDNLLDNNNTYYDISNSNLSQKINEIIPKTSNYNWGENIISPQSTLEFISKVDNTSNLSIEGLPKGYTPQIGDVIEINNTNHKYGHTAIYTNNGWVSDFKLKKAIPYSSGKSSIRIFRSLNKELAHLSAKEAEGAAGKHSKHECAKYVRLAINRAAGGGYNGEGYNGNQFGNYLLKRGWIQVAKQGLKTGEMYYSKYTPVKITSLKISNPNLEIEQLPQYRITSLITDNSSSPSSSEINYNWGNGVSSVTPIVIPTSNETSINTPTSTPTKELKGTNDFLNVINKYRSTHPNFNRLVPFFTKLADLESKFKSSIQNKIGATGYFLIMPETAEALGTTVDKLKNNPDLLIEVAHNLYNLYLKYFSKTDINKAKEKGYSESALVAGAWLAGPGGVKAFLYNNENRSDGGTTVKTRMDEFNNM